MKEMNPYACTMPQRDYDRIPKAVYAAIAVSALTCGGDALDDARRRVLAEWRILHQNGIVTQKPPRDLRVQGDSMEYPEEEGGE